MKEKDLEAEFIGKAPSPRPGRRGGTAIGAAGLVSFLGGGVAAVAFPTNLLAYPLALMVLGALLLLVGFLQLR